ncbi:class I SAM-dependent methyltransferase [Desulfacinum hydrothermale]|nr:class I SAM-dependent methyltransferase [Desulfacinum hydrothermale]
MMDGAETRSHFLHAYFREQDQKRGVYAVTAVGEFVPCSLTYLEHGMTHFLSRYPAARKFLFLDAGSGDGRVVFLLSVVFGLRAVGVEYDEQLHVRAMDNMASILRRYPASPPPTLLCGDFLDESLYRNHGLRFADFHVVFNYANNHTQLAEKVMRDGGQGAYFLLYTPRPTGERFPSLQDVSSLCLAPEPRTATGPYLQIYRRVPTESGSA